MYSKKTGEEETESSEELFERDEGPIEEETKEVRPPIARRDGVYESPTRRLVNKKVSGGLEGEQEDRRFALKV